MEVIKKFRARHGTRYDYSRVRYVNSNTKVDIICHDHGVFTQTPAKHTQGQGCPKCAHISTGMRCARTLEQFLKEAKTVHGDQYDYSEVTQYRSERSKITIICPEHGGFEITPEHHLRRKQGCKLCGWERRGKSQRKSLETFVKEARERYGESFDYSRVIYSGAHHHVEIICPRHGPFLITPRNHLNGSKCPECSQPGRKSVVANEWLQSLNIPNLILEYSIPGTRLSADGFDERRNTIYLFHGDYWHGNPKVFRPDAVNANNGKTFGSLFDKTLDTERRLVELGYTLVTMWERDWRRIRSNRENR